MSRRLISQTRNTGFSQCFSGVTATGEEPAGGPLHICKKSLIIKALACAFFLLLALPAMPQLLPERIGGSHLAAKAPAPTLEPAIWTELGLEDSGQGTYDGPAGSYTLTLYRVQDPTAALAAFYWQRPPEAKRSTLAPLTAETPDSLTVGSGNYLLIWKGHKVTPEELNALLLTIPKYQSGNLPALPKFLPSTGLRANSERYIVGPASLRKFYPEISPSAAGFHLSAEAEAAVFGPNGGVRLVIFAYPTFEMARKQLVEFEKIPGAMVRRTGSLVAVTVHPLDPDEAERVLSRVKYQVDVTLPEKPPTPRDNPANLLLNIVLLIGILIVFCTISGVAFGLLRQVFRRFGPSDDGESMVALHLSDR
jgi:hypothetical protein